MHIPHLISKLQEADDLNGEVTKRLTEIGSFEISTDYKGDLVKILSHIEELTYLRQRTAQDGCVNSRIVLNKLHSSPPMIISTDEDFV